MHTSSAVRAPRQWMGGSCQLQQAAMMVSWYTGVSESRPLRTSLELELYENKSRRTILPVSELALFVFTVEG